MPTPDLFSSESTPARTAGLVSMLRSLANLLRTSGQVAAPPVMRAALALPFLRSGLTRWDGSCMFRTAPGSFSRIFSNCTSLARFIRSPSPDFVATLTSSAEIALPLLLIAGLGTRFAALSLLAMTAVIQLVEPGGWANFHLYWAALALGLMATGAGALSMDRIVESRMWRAKTAAS